jgi:hypothetical protein
MNTVDCYWEPPTDDDCLLEPPMDDCLLFFVFDDDVILHALPMIACWNHRQMIAFCSWHSMMMLCAMPMFACWNHQRMIVWKSIKYAGHHSSFGCSFCFLLSFVVAEDDL